MALATKLISQGVESLLSKSLTEVVRGIRSNKGNAAGESEFISSCVQAIRKELRSTNREVKVTAVLKLAYLQMLGYDMGWAAPDVIEVMSFPRFAHKRIGYLAASVSFTPSTDILIMSTNLFRKDVTSSNQYEAGCALNALACVVTPDLARDLAPDVVSLLSHSKPYIKKKAIMVLYHIFLEFPDALRPAYPKLKEKLKDEDLSTVAAVVSVLCELARKNPANYVKLAPTLFNLLVTANAHSWLQLKLVKLFALLCPVEPRLPKRLVEPLTNIINTTPVMSLLYECINTCTVGLVKHLPIIRLCIQKLRMFIESKDQNHKYLGLLALGNIMEVHPKAVREHKDTVLACLNDEDESIRLRALDLLVGMVDKKNLADIVERLLDHVNSKAEGHYKSQVISKVIAISSQRDFKFITDFEWYIGVLVRLSRVPGNEQGKLISDQLLDVAVRVEVVRKFAVRQMVFLLQDQRFYQSQSQIVEVLYAAAFVCGEFSDRKDAVLLLQSFVDPQVRSIPGHLQSIFISSALKVFARVAGKASAGGSGNSDLLGLTPEQASQQDNTPDDKAVETLESCLGVLDKGLPIFAESEVVEVQERACFLQQVLRVYRAVGNASVALEITSLFLQSLNPVHPDAQNMVPVPEGLDLNAQINEWPEEEVEESFEEDNTPGGLAAEFGGYQHPGSIAAGGSSSNKSASTAPVDKRYYLSGSVSPTPGGVGNISVPETEPLDLGGMKVIVKEPRKKQGKKHQKAKIVTDFAVPAGASPSQQRGPSGASAGSSSKDALSSIKLDEDLTVQEKDLLQHKTYPGATVAAVKTPVASHSPVSASSPSGSSSPVQSSEEVKKKGKKGKKASGKKDASPSAAAAAPVVEKKDPYAPQVICGATDSFSGVCRVLQPDAATPKNVTVQIALQNRSLNPWISASFEFKPSPVFKLLSRSLPNTIAVAPQGLAPLLCVFEAVTPVSAPVLIECSFVAEKGGRPIACSFTIQPSLFVVPQKVALEEFGKRISKSAAQLQSASGNLQFKDQKSGLKLVSELLRCKKVRVDQGAALLYGQTVHGQDVFVHIKRTSDVAMLLEIKSQNKALAQSLVQQAQSLSSTV